jgi:hypothetical protein
MAVIYLRHPLHGAKVATSDMEAEKDFQNGWEEFDPAEPVTDPAPQAEVVVDDTPPVEAPVVNELQPRRRGRRPREATE